MAAILDKALGMAISEASDVVVGKSIGGQFCEKAALPAEGDKPAVKAVTAVDLKEAFYKRALEELKPKEVSHETNGQNQAGVVSPLAIPTTETEENKPAFVPEIVEIERAPKAEETEPISVEL